MHTANLVLPESPDANSGKSGSHTPWAVGSMIPAELHLRHTRRWCPPSRRESQANLSFTYEVLANPDTWLIGGRRRGNFTATEAEGREGLVFKVMLLPQRPGCLLLPSVDVKAFTAGTEGTGPADGSAGAATREPVTSEVDYKNHGETVIVTPDLGSTTVSLGTSPGALSSDGQGMGMAGWLVASERRVTAQTSG